MFERLTERSRRVLVAAQEEAVFLNHGYIGTEHILLGLVRENEGVGARVLHDRGADAGKRACAGCGRRWTISYAVSWREASG